MGDILHERYRLQELLGSGSQGEVYAAWDQKLERRVAIKLLNSHFKTDSQDDEAYTRFRREAKLTARFEHPHVVKLFDYDVTADGKPYLVMGYLNGTTIDRLDPPLTQPELGLFVKQIGYALQNAHENNLVHRDLKPANITFVERGQPLQRFILLDLGIAKLCDISDGSSLTFVHATSAGAGTPLYMSPEQTQGESGDHRSDIYSLGSMLFQFLTGQAPFLHRAHSPLALLYSIATMTAPRLSEIAPQQGYSNDLEQLLAECLEKNPDDRPQSVRELVERFEAVSGIPARPQAKSAVSSTTGGVEGLTDTGTSLPALVTGIPPLTGPLETSPRQHTTGPQGTNQTPPNKRRWTLVIGGSVIAALLLAIFLWPSTKQLDDRRQANNESPPPQKQGDQDLESGDAATAAIPEQSPSAPPIPVIKLQAIPETAVSEGELFEYQVRLEDAETQSVTLQYELGPGAPEGLSIDPQSGVMHWTPTESQGPGKQKVTVHVREVEGEGESHDETAFTIDVHEVNRPPQLEEIANPTIEVDREMTVNVVAKDADLPQNRLQFRLVESPERMEIDIDTGRITWKPTVSHASQSFPVKVSVSDGNAESERTFTVDIKLAPVVTNSIGMKLALIPAGEFLMGSPESEEQRDNHEHQHKVRISQPFYLGMYEVTQAEYEQVMGNNPSAFSATGSGKSEVSEKDISRFPVESVSWFDAIKFCNQLSERERRKPYYVLSALDQKQGGTNNAEVKIAGGNGYRLPTEAEWEYACRAGTTTPFHFGSQLNGQEANVDGNDPYGTATQGPYLKRTTVVGSYRPNDFGLYDMHGNVWEWCQDWYGAEYYLNSPASDPPGPSDGTFRTLRSGSWLGGALVVRSGFRGRDAPDFRRSFTGFRVVRVDVASAPATLPASPSPGPKPSPTQEPVPAEFITDSIGLKLALIPAGEFRMGSPETEPQSSNDERQHLVKIAKPFYLGVHEVTRDQFRKFVESSDFKTEAETNSAGGHGYNAAKNILENDQPQFNWRNTGWRQTEAHPVVNVSWNDATAFCNWLTRQAGKTYRLPTEAEWEYACRAGTNTVYHSGDDPEGLARVGNVADAAYRRQDIRGSDRGISADDQYIFTAPVGTFLPNSFGVHDMHGNVQEWCQDWYEKDYPQSSPGSDPPGKPAGSLYRVLRGGAWDSYPRLVRSANRAKNFPTFRSGLIGFRVLREVDE